MFFLYIRTFLIASRKPILVESFGGSTAMVSETARLSPTANESETIRESPTARLPFLTKAAFFAASALSLAAFSFAAFSASAALRFSSAAFFAARLGSFCAASSAAFAAASAAFLRYSPTGSTFRSESLFSAATTAKESTSYIGIAR